MEDVDSDYATLEVRPDASWEEIQRAYHDLVRVWHPDRFGSDRRLQERAERTLQQINDAYRRLEARRAFRAGQPIAPAEKTSSSVEAEIRFSDAAQPPIRTAPAPLSKPAPRWVRSVALPAVAGAFAIAGWLAFLGYLATPRNGPLPIRDPTSVRIGSLTEKTVDLAAIPDTSERPNHSLSDRRTRPKGQPREVRPQNGELLSEPAGPSGTGAIQILNHHDEDIIAEIWQSAGRSQLVWSVYVRSHQEVTIAGIGLGIYRANFKGAPWPESDAGGEPERVSYYGLQDALQFYEIRSAGGTQAVRYVITVP